MAAGDGSNAEGPHEYDCDRCPCTVFFACDSLPQIRTCWGCGTRYKRDSDGIGVAA